jgi:hypothetical protein
MSLFPIIRSTEGVKAAKDRLLATAQSVDKSVQQCGALDSTTRASWGLFYASIIDFAREDVPFFGTGQFSDQLSVNEQELYTWQQKLGVMCTLNLPLFNPTVTDPESATLLQFARYGLLAAGIIGGAYTVGKIVEFAKLVPGTKGKG